MAKELTDYSGKFNPKLTYNDFSKEQLVRLLSAWWKIGLRVDTWWHQIIEEKVSTKVARDCETQCWVRIAPEEIAFMRGALNVTENDVASFWKVMQNDIGFPQEMFDNTWDLKNNNHGILTVNNCRGYDACLALYGENRSNWMCNDLETAAFDAYTRAFNPNIKVKCLKLPPKKNDSEPACKWEFTLDSKANTAKPASKEKVQKELQDYSGPFNPKLTYNDFSKEQLVRLLEAWWKIGLRIDTWWHEIVSEKLGEKLSRDCDTEMWVRIAPEEIAFMRGALNVTENDVASFWKVMQNDLGFPQGLFDVTWDLKNNNHGTITVHRCGGYDSRLDAKGEEYCHWMCEVLETAAFAGYTAAFNPDIKVDCLKLPPKKNDAEPACQWEFTLDNNKAKSSKKTSVVDSWGGKIKV